MSRHIHLDPLGGIAGDMFAAAMLDAIPELEEPLRADLAAAGIAGHVTLQRETVRKAGFAALQVRFAQAESAPPTRHWRDIRALLKASALERDVRDRAIAIFARLAEAEAAAHGVRVDDVHFHEIADWDSLADIVAAASLSHRADASGWSVAPLALGSGRVRTAHGPVPVPAPATVHLLRGFDTIEDGIGGERVTPTGAAILATLCTSDGAPQQARVSGRIGATGTGAGQRDLEGIANILRATAIETAAQATGATREPLVQFACEIDDMTPEELSVALDRLRQLPGCVDATLLPGIGKKGRPAFALRLLCHPPSAAALRDRIFAETSTLGLRETQIARHILPRTQSLSDGMRVKCTDRASGPTAKVESDDLAALPDLASRRQAAGRAERLAVQELPEVGDD
ncbi:nickel pincer cofactor biosynthesis protein LarC [Oceanomicrobium pacificus]|uniref:DUF111 family protein n=1 Tax=Oceanomicrobium pacificus TaxID=2692916 RepID=A0A6B0TVL4_9RHOB|nr:LarC family nickel insertion protein [Oceanomicrobium pacificus]MXU65194.1 DUF111 family protein [Oceanomicrobium pacificus]